MNKIKDLLYDTNDILVAVLILCCATFVIFTRIDAIMTYPGQMLTTQKAQPADVYASDPGVQVSIVYNDAEDTDTDLPEGDTAEAGTQAGNAGQPAYSLHIPPNQSMSEVGRNLVDMGFFERTQDFYDALNSHNAAQRVQVGTFVIPADSTTDDIIRIITGRNQ